MSEAQTYLENLKLKQGMDDLGPRQHEALRILQPEVFFGASLMPLTFCQVGEDLIVDLGMCLIVLCCIHTPSEFYYIKLKNSHT